MNKLSRLRNWQSHEFWARLFARPLCILFLYPVADLRWVTPNRITHAGNLAFAGALVCLQFDHWIWATVLLQVHLILDHMDGTLARYRGAGSRLGSYYDKISDCIGISVLFAILGWQAYRLDPSQPLWIVLGCTIAMMEIIMGYSKWVVEAMQTKEPHLLPQTASRGGPGQAGPPERTWQQWLLWTGGSFLQVLRFEEVDYFFWIGLALIIGRLDWVLLLLGGTRLAGMIGTLVYRAWIVYKMDKQAASKNVSD